MIEDRFELFFKHLKEKLQQYLSVISSGVQQTVVNEVTDKSTETMFLGLCSCKVMPFVTYVVMMDATYPLLTFSSLHGCTFHHLM